MAPKLRNTALVAIDTADRSQLPDSFFTDIILGAEAEFLAAPERKRLGDGSPFPTQSTKGWYIPAIEGGPSPYRTKADFAAAQDKLEDKLDNANIAHDQLYNFSVIDGMGNPLGLDKQPLAEDTALHTAIQSLIEKYRYQEESDEAEVNNIKHIPNYKPQSNAFSTFMAQRKKIFKRFNIVEEQLREEDKLASESEDAGPSYKRVVSSDDEVRAKPIKKRKWSSPDSDEETEVRAAKAQYMTKFSPNSVRILELKTPSP